MNRSISRRASNPKPAPDAGVGHTGSDLVPRRSTLDGFATEVAVTEGINVREAEPLVPILVATQNSLYRIIPLRWGNADVLVQGGQFFPEPTQARLAGSTFGSSFLKTHWISAGMHGEIDPGTGRGPIITTRVGEDDHQLDEQGRALERHRLLLQLLRRLLQPEQLLPSNPCWGVEFPVAVKGLFRPHYASWSEQQRIEAEASIYLRHVVRIVTETGLRIYKELTPMKKDQVDLDNKVVWIPDSKTPNGVADVPLTDLAVAAFRNQMETTGNSPYLFPRENNPTGHQTTFKTAWTATLRRAKAG